MATIAVDWDGTCVGYRRFGDPLNAELPDEWLPGAVEALRKLSARASVVIWTCRTLMPEGEDSIRDMLDEAGLTRVHIHVGSGKTIALAYVDDRAVRFSSWEEQLPQLLDLIHEHNVAHSTD